MPAAPTPLRFADFELIVQRSDFELRIVAEFFREYLRSSRDFFGDEARSRPLLAALNRFLDLRGGDAYPFETAWSKAAGVELSRYFSWERIRRRLARPPFYPVHPPPDPRSLSRTLAYLFAETEDLNVAMEAVRLWASLQLLLPGGPERLAGVSAFNDFSLNTRLPVLEALAFAWVPEPDKPAFYLLQSHNADPSVKWWAVQSLTYYAGIQFAADRVRDYLLHEPWRDEATLLLRSIVDLPYCFPGLESLFQTLRREVASAPDSLLARELNRIEPLLARLLALPPPPPPAFSPSQPPFQYPASQDPPDAQLLLAIIRQPALLEPDRPMESFERALKTLCQAHRQEPAVYPAVFDAALAHPSADCRYHALDWLGRAWPERPLTLMLLADSVHSAPTSDECDVAGLRLARIFRHHRSARRFSAAYRFPAYNSERP
jgi:hypothetical protein